MVLATDTLYCLDRLDWLHGTRPVSYRAMHSTWSWLTTTSSTGRCLPRRRKCSLLERFFRIATERLLERSVPTTSCSDPSRLQEPSLLRCLVLRLRCSLQLPTHRSWYLASPTLLRSLRCLLPTHIAATSLRLVDPTISAHSMFVR